MSFRTQKSYFVKYVKVNTSMCYSIVGIRAYCLKAKYSF